jgi:peptide/nickel transport system substrate-binding protein
MTPVRPSPASLLPKLQSSKRQISRREFFQYSSALGLAVAVSSSLAACAPQVPTAVTPADSASPTSLAEIIYGYGAEAVTLDMADAIDGPSQDVTDNLHEGLLEMGPDGEILPALAESWQLQEDGLTWTFFLRSDVQFHDGTPFNAEAVKFNFDRVMDEALGHANQGQWAPHISEVRVVDEYTVEIVTFEPYASLGLKLADSFGKLMNSPAAVAEHGPDYGRNPVGTGPFMFESWSPGEHIVLARNPNYWRSGPGVETLRFRPISEGSVRLLAIEGGDIQVINQVPAQSLAMLRENAQVQVQQKTITRLFYWAFNHTKDAWKDPMVRKALNHAIDRQSIVDNILFGVGEVAASFVSPSVPSSVSLSDYQYDPELARSLLEEAGYDFDYVATCYATEGRYYQDRQVAEAVQGMLAQVGVQINLEILEWGAFVDAIWFTPADDPVAQARDFMQTSFGSNDPPTWMNQTLHTNAWPLNGFNEAFYSNAQVDSLIDDANRTADVEAQSEIVRTIQGELEADPPWIISHFEQAVIAHSANLTGLFIWPSGRVNFREVRSI